MLRASSSSICVVLMQGFLRVAAALLPVVGAACSRAGETASGPAADFRQFTDLPLYYLVGS